MTLFFSFFTSTFILNHFVYKGIIIVIYVKNISFYCCLAFFPHCVFVSEDYKPAAQCAFFPNLRYKIWEKEYFMSVLRKSLHWLELTLQKKTGDDKLRFPPHAIFLGGCNTVVHLQKRSTSPHSLMRKKRSRKMWNLSDEGLRHNLSGKKFRSRSDVVPHG